MAKRTLELPKFVWVLDFVNFSQCVKINLFLLSLQVSFFFFLIFFDFEILAPPSR